MPPPTHPTATLADLYQLSVKYIPKADPDIMAAIAMAESGGKYNVTNTNNNGSVDTGLWQINSVHKLGNLKDPVGNAKAANIVYTKQGYTAWTVYKTGAYKEFMPENVHAPGVGSTGLNTDIGGIITGNISSMKELWSRGTMNIAYVIIALVFLILGVLILTGSTGNVKKTVKTVKKVAAP
jgi:hypothetical protein